MICMDTASRAAHDPKQGCFPSAANAASLGSSDDQKRTLSAKEAIDLGADIIVVGRPITSAESPMNAAKTFIQSIK